MNEVMQEWKIDFTGNSGFKISNQKQEFKGKINNGIEWFLPPPNEESNIADIEEMVMAEANRIGDLIGKNAYQIENHRKETLREMNAPRWEPFVAQIAKLLGKGWKYEIVSKSWRYEAKLTKEHRVLFLCCDDLTEFCDMPLAPKIARNTGEIVTTSGKGTLCVDYSLKHGYSNYFRVDYKDKTINVGLKKNVERIANDIVRRLINEFEYRYQLAVESRAKAIGEGKELYALAKSVQELSGNFLKIANDERKNYEQHKYDLRVPYNVMDKIRTKTNTYHDVEATVHRTCGRHPNKKTKEFEFQNVIDLKFSDLNPEVATAILKAYTKASSKG